eukprot:scaffold1922_cov291-Chaetoceros_neogracile.AAC.2
MPKTLPLRKWLTHQRLKQLRLSCLNGAFSIDAIPLRDSSKHHQQHQQEQQKDHHQHSIHNNTESYRIAISTAGKRLVSIDMHQLNTPTPTATITLYQSRIIAQIPIQNM